MEAAAFHVEVCDIAEIDQMVNKIRALSQAPGEAEQVAAWRAEHGNELWVNKGHDHCVVGTTLMYLHDAPDGMLVPHARYPDGVEKVFTDAAHADQVYDPD